MADAMNWMYKDPKSMIDKEEYLLGRKIDKNVDESDGKQSPKKYNYSICGVGEKIAKKAEDSNDADANDPLLIMKMKEVDAKKELLLQPKIKKLEEKMGPIVTIETRIDSVDIEILKISSQLKSDVNIISLYRKLSSMEKLEQFKEELNSFKRISKLKEKIEKEQRRLVEGNLSSDSCGDDEEGNHRAKKRKMKHCNSQDSIRGVETPPPPSSCRKAYTNVSPLRRGWERGRFQRYRNRGGESCGIVDDWNDDDDRWDRKPRYSYRGRFDSRYFEERSRKCDGYHESEGRRHREKSPRDERYRKSSGFGNDIKSEGNDEGRKRRWWRHISNSYERGENKNSQRTDEKGNRSKELSQREREEKLREMQADGKERLEKLKKMKIDEGDKYGEKMDDFDENFAKKKFSEVMSTVSMESRVKSKVYTHQKSIRFTYA